MKKNKVIAQLITLPDGEFKQFGKFVRNPVHNKKETVARLYDFIKKNHPTFEEPKFTKTHCFSYVFPELKADLKQLNGKADELISSKLKNPLYIIKKLFDDFILQQALVENSHEKTILFIKALFKRQMHERAFQLIDKELKRLDGVTGQDFYHHFHQFQLRELKEQACLDIVSADQQFFLKMINDLDLFYLHAKLKLGYEAKSREDLLGQENNILLYHELQNIVMEGKIKNITLPIKVYEKISKLNNNNSLEFYQKTKQIYLENFNLLHTSDQKDILIYLFNFRLKFCQEQDSETEKDRYKEMFYLYEFGLSKNLFLINGYLSADHFKNIIIASSCLKKFDWARNFIETKSHLLLPEIRESMVKLANAQIEDADRNNEKVIALLQNVEFANTYDNLTARSLLLRAYYELNEWHTLEYFLASYTKYLKRNTSISENVQLSIINMIKFTKILIQAKFKKTEKQKLFNILSQLTPVYSKKWLMRKIELL